MSDDETGPASDAVEAQNELLEDGAEPDFEKIQASFRRLREFVESPGTAQALEAGQKEATLCIHALLCETRAEEGAMSALGDVIAILAHRRSLSWSAAARGPYVPLVHIVYPGLKPGAHNAVANALERIRGMSVEEARKAIKGRGGIDAMYRAPKSKGRVPPSSKRPSAKK